MTLIYTDTMSPAHIGQVAFSENYEFTILGFKPEENRVTVDGPYGVKDIHPKTIFAVYQ